MIYMVFKKINNEKLILSFIVFYIITFLYFYPPFYGSSDEQEYLHGAYLLRKGTLSTNDPLYSYQTPFDGKKYIYINFIGESILLLPFTFFGWSSAFLSGMLLHLIGVFVFYKILKRLKIDTKNTLLYLLFPPILYLTRTLYNSLPAAVLVLVAFYFYTSQKKRDHILACLCFGAVALFRYPDVLVFL